MSSPSLFYAFTAVACIGTMGAVLCGPISATINDSTEQSRIDTLRAAAQTACAVTSAEAPVTAASVQSDCSDATENAIHDLRGGIDSRYFLILPDREGNKRYHDALASIQNKIPAQNKNAFAARVAWNEQDNAKDALNTQVSDKLTQRIQSIVIGNERPFAHASVNADFESVIPITDARGRQTRAFTGKFSVTITDPGSSASRVFAYDHATENVTQTMGETAGAYSFHMDFNAVSNSYSLRGGNGTAYTSGSGDGGGSILLSSTGPVDCQGQRRAACEVIGAVHQVLNGLNPDQMSNLQNTVAGDPDGKAARITAYAYPDVNL